MARPIMLATPVRDARKELTEQLQQAPAEHAEALLEAYELLQLLHDRQILALMRGGLEAGDKLVEAATHAADSLPSVAALRNLIILGKALGSINPAVTQGLAAAVKELAPVPQEYSESKQDSKSKQDTASRQNSEPPSFLSLLGQMRRKEVRRGMAVVNQLLGALGRHLDAKPDENWVR